MSSPDSVLDTIDGALCDWSVSADAMRWSPDPEAAAKMRRSPAPQFDFGLQIRLWRCVITGDVLNFSALVAEGHALADGGRHWDRAAADLDGQMIGRGNEPMRRVKDWAALPWVAEHCIRQHEEWPGL